VLRIRQFLPDPRSNFFHTGSRFKKIPDPNPHQRIYIFFNPKNCTYDIAKNLYFPGAETVGKQYGNKDDVAKIFFSSGQVPADNPEHWAVP
jgi:hypothetical protein